MSDSARNSERLAVVETELKYHQSNMQDLVGALTELTKEVHVISKKLDRSGAFFAGIAFAFSMLGTAVGYFLSITTKHI